ncbi:MAG: hypothetical protein JF603_16005, partial [Acidobacteria bacterium]|nr:hypothetical protein [Acidobacteriota bacterium]
MTDNRDELDVGRFADAPRPRSGPEDWLGIPDPVASFGNTIDQAMRQLAL